MRRVFLVLSLLPLSAWAMFFPAGGIHINSPQIVSLSIGGLGMNTMSGLGSATAAVIRLEPGIGGGKINIGFKSVVRFSVMPLSTFEIDGSLLRTWGSTWGAPSGQTYAGGELRIGVSFIFASAGMYKHIAGDGEDDNLFTFGVGAGI